MYVINANAPRDDVYSRLVFGLAVGYCYEFSVFAANLVVPAGYIRPELRFEIRTGNNRSALIAQRDTGPINRASTMTWIKFGISFFTSVSDVYLNIISIATSGNGNDFALDDISLRRC